MMEKFSNFNSFVSEILPKLSTSELFATSSHLKMATLEREQMLKVWDYSNKNPKKAATLILFYPKREETYFVLIQRTNKGIHSAQVSFPGGKFDSETDQSYYDTALRETYEEIGVFSNDIQYVNALSPLYVPPSNFLVHPFTAYTEKEPIFIPSEDEVEQIIEISLKDFLNSEIKIKEFQTSYFDSIQAPFFDIYSYQIWGATAMILSELKDILNTIKK